MLQIQVHLRKVKRQGDRQVEQSGRKGALTSAEQQPTKQNSLLPAFVPPRVSLRRGPANAYAANLRVLRMPQGFYYCSLL